LLLFEPGPIIEQLPTLAIWNCWFVPPLQVHWSMLVPSVVPAPTTSSTLPLLRFVKRW
jgi:hypothetical protein